MKIESQSKKQATGSGGWVEGYETIKIQVCVVSSLSTGLKVRIPYDIVSSVGKVTPQMIRQAVNSRYDKEYRRFFGSESNAFLEQDFDLNGGWNLI